MKLLKRITAVMAALLIAANIIVINVSAVMAAPVVADGFVEFLVTLLLAGGHSQSEIDVMDVTQMQSTVADDLDIGKITLDTTVIDPVTGIGITVLEFMNKPENKAARDILSISVDRFVSDWKDGYDYILKPTPTTVFYDGCGSYFTYIASDGRKYMILCDYIVINEGEEQTFTVYGNTNKYYPVYVDDGRGWYQDGQYGVYVEGSTQWLSTYPSNISFFGDVRYADGSQAPTDDMYEYPLGVVAGTTVTPDMLNPDGTVTIDGVTYNPADFFKPDNLTDEGKKQLINNISFVINNTYVISEDKPLVDAGSIDVSLPAELEDFKVSPSIITVFPFCLPFDFVRGMKTLVQKPKVPVFKTELDLTNFCGYNLGKHTIEISFEKWEPAAVICRWFSLLLFTYTLILLSGKIVKGAGS